MDPREAESFDPVIHQAEGSLAARLKVPIDQAAMILRIRAHSLGLPLSAIAAEEIGPLKARRDDPNTAGSC